MFFDPFIYVLKELEVTAGDSGRLADSGVTQVPCHQTPLTIVPACSDTVSRFMLFKTLLTSQEICFVFLNILAASHIFLQQTTFSGHITWSSWPMSPFSDDFPVYINGLYDFSHMQILLKV